MARKNYHSQFVDFDSGYAPVSNVLRRSQFWHRLTPVQQLSYIEIVGRYFEFGRPKSFFDCPYSCVRGSISKSAWLRALPVLDKLNFIVLQHGYKNKVKLCNGWQTRCSFDT